MPIYAKRKDTLVFKDAASKEILIYKHIESEVVKDYRYLKEEFICIGHIITSVTTESYISKNQSCVQKLENKLALSIIYKNYKKFRYIKYNQRT